jgi:hypothetical protein
VIDEPRIITAEDVTLKAVIDVAVMPQAFTSARRQRIKRIGTKVEVESWCEPSHFCALCDRDEGK